MCVSRMSLREQWPCVNSDLASLTRARYMGCIANLESVRLPVVRVVKLFPAALTQQMVTTSSTANVPARAGTCTACILCVVLRTKA
jgi:hypothetical protein